MSCPFCQDTAVLPVTKEPCFSCEAGWALRDYLQGMLPTPSPADVDAPDGAVEQRSQSLTAGSQGIEARE